MSQRLMWIQSGAGFLLAVTMALVARGLASDEEVGHFLIARHAPAHPELILSTYGRPLVTLWFLVPAQAGLWAARIAAAVLAGLTTLAVLRIVKPARWYHAGIVLPCLFLQPYYLAHSGTVMTEPVAACLVAWGILAFVERRFLLLAVIAGLLPVARQEWVLFWPVLAWILVRERRWIPIAIIPLPMMLWGAVGGFVHGDPLWIARQVGWREYTAREVLHYVKGLAWILGVGLLAPVMIGLARAIWAWFTTRFKNREPEAGQDALVISAVLLLTMIPVYTYFAVWHPITYGMHRFFAGLAAPIAILAVAGLGWFSRGHRLPVWIALGITLVGSVFLWNHPIHSDMTIMARDYWLAAGVTGTWLVLYLLPARFRRIAPVLMITAGVFFLARDHVDTLHWKLEGEHAVVAEASVAIRPMLGEEPIILKAAPLLPFFLEMDPNQKSLFPDPNTRNLRKATPGTWLFWDSHYLTGRGSAYSLKSIVDDGTWEFRAGFVARDSVAAIAIFRKSASVDSTVKSKVEQFVTTAARAQAGLHRLEEKLADDPDNAKLARALATRYFRIGLNKDAVRTLNRAQRIDPDQPDNKVILVSILNASGQTERALEIARIALNRHPEHGGLNYIFGRVLLDAKRVHDARGYLLKAAELMPKDENVQFVAGSVLLQAQKWAEAEKYLVAARSMKPERRETLLYLAESTRRQGRLEESEQLLRELLELYPNSAGAYMMLGEVLLRAGKGDEAREVLTTGHEVTKDPAIKGLLDRMPRSTP